MSSDTILRLQGICLQHRQHQILKSIDLSLSPAQIVTVIGPNGAGKSSLIKIAVGLIKADSGAVYRRQGLRIGYMPQRLSINPLMPLSVERFLRMGKRALIAVDDAMAMTGIEHLRRRPLHDISGGETQRVLLSRALLNSPELLVLDEPAQGVDITGQAELYELIGRIRDQLGCAVLMVSHDLHWVMAKTDTVICLNQHICCHGHPEQVSLDPAYLSLFGSELGDTLAIYQHDHDHQHDLHGDVICEHDHD